MTPTISAKSPARFRLGPKASTASSSTGAGQATASRHLPALGRHRVELKFGAIAVLLLGGLVALNRTHAFAGFDPIMLEVMGLLAEVGFAGIFVISAIANASLVVHIPYTVPVISLALSGASLETMLWAGLWAGFGCTVGEVVSYFLASKVLGQNPSLASSSLFQWIRRNVSAHPRLIPGIVFVCAISPLPDDAVIIPLAMARYPLRLMLLPLLIGKVIHTVAAAGIIYFLADSFNESAGVNVDLALGMLIVFVLGIFYQVEKGHSSATTPAAALAG